MGWLFCFGILLLLAVIPLGLRISYDSDGLRLSVILGPAKIAVFPRPQREKKRKPEKIDQKQFQGSSGKEKTASEPQNPPVQKASKQESLSGGNIRDFFPLIKIGLDFLGDFRRKIRLDDLYLRFILAASDPCDLAVNYGKSWAAVGNLLPVLEKYFVIKNRDVQVECDFTSSETKVIARANVTITFGRLVSLAAVYGFRALKEYLAIRNQRKGGVAK